MGLNSESIDLARDGVRFIYSENLNPSPFSPESLPAKSHAPTSSISLSETKRNSHKEALEINQAQENLGTLLLSTSNKSNY
jgi:hypothetical protein